MAVSFSLTTLTWKKVATDEQCAHINLKGEANNLHSKLQTAINSREAPSQILQEVNESIKRLENLDDVLSEKGSDDEEM